jgi:hypothetical protein
VDAVLALLLAIVASRPSLEDISPLSAPLPATVLPFGVTSLGQARVGILSAVAVQSTDTFRRAGSAILDAEIGVPFGLALRFAVPLTAQTQGSEYQFGVGSPQLALQGAFAFEMAHDLVFRGALELGVFFQSPDHGFLRFNDLQLAEPKASAMIGAILGLVHESGLSLSVTVSDTDHESTTVEAGAMLVRDRLWVRGGASIVLESDLSTNHLAVFGAIYRDKTLPMLTVRAFGSVPLEKSTTTEAPVFGLAIAYDFLFKATIKGALTEPTSSRLPSGGGG